MSRLRYFDDDDVLAVDDVEGDDTSGAVDDGGNDPSVDDLHESIAAMQRQNERQSALPQLHRDIDKVIAHVRATHSRSVTFTAPFVDSLRRLTLTYAERVGGDAEHFAKHAKRTRLTTDDVMLTTRNNPSLNEQMTAFINEHQLAVALPKRRRTAAAKENNGKNDRDQDFGDSVAASTRTQRYTRYDHDNAPDGFEDDDVRSIEHSKSRQSRRPSATPAKRVKPTAPSHADDDWD